MSINNSKKNVLIVTSFLPYPLNVGGKIRIYKLCKLLSDRYNFILLSLINHEKELNYIPELKKIFKEVYLVIERSEPKDIFYPVSYRGSYSIALIKKFKEIIERYFIKLIHIESNELLYLAEFTKSLPIVYTEHDISSLSFNKSYYKPIGFFVCRLYDYLKRIRFHKKLYKKVKKILVLSETDKKILESIIPNKEIYYLPTGVDLDYFSFQEPKDGSNNLIFIGWYLHYPNEDAVIYFSKKIFPIVKKVLPDIEFLIVGADPTERVKKLTNEDGIKLIGPVRDVREYLRRSAVFVSPIRVGAGIKGKVLEAMATGIPVVSNKRGCYGIQALDGKEILIAETPNEFVYQIKRLLNDPVLRFNLVTNARKLIEKRYDWRRIIINLDEIYRDTISNTFNITK